MDIIYGYINYIKNVKKLSENTVVSYYMDIKRYLTYLSDEEIDLNDVSKSNIIEFSIKLEKENCSVATISRMISSIKSFHEYACMKKICESNPSLNFKKPRIKKTTVEILTEEEVADILNFPKLDSPKLIRDKAILEILYGTGVKVSELADMNYEDLDFELNCVHCNSCRNKRVIPMLDCTRKYLLDYIDRSREYMLRPYNSESEKALFISNQGHRFTRQGLWKIIKKYSKLAKIDKNINPTMLRNSFAIHLLNKGANLSVVSKILGNSNLSSVQAYIDYIDENIRKELLENHREINKSFTISENICNRCNCYYVFKVNKGECFY